MQFRSLGLAVFLVILITSFGANGQTGDDSGNTQAESPQDTPASNESIDLKQRTPIPFEIRKPAQDTLPLLAIMANLEQNMAVVQAGIWRGNYEAISKAAMAMVNHGKIPKREIQKIESILGTKGLKGFVAADKAWHDKTKELAQVASEKNMKQIVKKTANVFQRCAGCHIKYRAPLRNSPKWLAR